MSIVNDTSFSFNKQFEFIFSGGELYSNRGLFLLKEFVHRLGFKKVIRDNSQTNDSVAFRFHTDDKTLMQRIFQILTGCFNDIDADDLPQTLYSVRFLARMLLLLSLRYLVFSTVWMKIRWCSSRRYSASCVRKSTGSGRRKTFSLIWIPHSCRLTAIRKGKVSTIITKDPLLCFDGLTGDLPKAELRKETKYCSSDAHLFLDSPLNEFLNWFKRLVFPKHFQKMQIETFRLKLIRIAARVIRSSRYRSFRFCSNYSYKDAFRVILLNIQQLQIPEPAF